MSVKELAFRYSTEGAKAAQRADSKVREQVRETGKTARQESGAVDRWMQRNRRAVQMTAVATLGAATAIISSSGRMRAELGGVRSAFGLFADTIIGDVLPSTGSLSQAALDVVMAYRNLNDTVRSWISALTTAAAAASAWILVGGKLTAALSAILPSATALGQAFGAITVAAKVAGGAIATAAAGITATTVALGAGVAAVVAFAAAYLTNFRGVRDTTNEIVGRVIGRLKSLASGALSWGKQTIGNLASAITSRAKLAREAAGDVRDRIADRITDLVTSARQRGRDFVSGLVSGIRDRISAIRGVAKDVAGAIREYMPSSPADRGPLSDLDKVGPGMAETVASGMEANTGRVARGASSLAGGMAGGLGGGRAGGGGGVTVVFESGAIQLRGSGRSREDGQRVADEVSSALERDLGSRGV